jgi:hypothetical protein
MKNNIVIEQQITDPVEEAAKAAISTVIARKAEIKEKKSELEDILMSHEAYKNAVAQAKLAAQVKKEKRDEIIEASTKARAIDADIKELSKEKGEKQLSLFDYLLDLSQRKGQKEIRDLTGQKHDIIISAAIKI